MKKRKKSPVRKEHITESMCSHDAAREIIRGLPFFTVLPSDDFEQPASIFKDIGYAPEERIYLEGTPADTFYVVAEGKVKLIRYSESGEYLLLDILGKGEFFGTLSLSGNANYRETAVAHTECCILRTSTTAFREIVESRPAVALSVLDILSGRLRELEERVHSLSVHTAEQRIALTLRTLARKFGEREPEGILIQTQVSREEIAALSGTTVETASRTLSAFQKDGLIESGRRWIRVLHPDQLADFS